jgi:hypothetical protein
MRNHRPEPVFWWLSFSKRVRIGNVSSVKWVAIICAESLDAAIELAEYLGIHPGAGATVRGFQIPPEHVPDVKYHHLLLSRKQAMEMKPNEEEQ